MRLQLALNVDDLESAVSFYSKMFGVAAAKRQPGYANFAIEDPPLKLVLFEGAGADGSINHLGVEVDAASEVTDAQARLTSAGLATTGVADTTCCYAEKTETWLEAPDGNRWEWYVKNADVDVASMRSHDATNGCCTPGLESVSIVPKNATVSSV